MSERTEEAEERWQRLKSLRLMFMAVAMFCWFIHLLVVLDMTHNMTALNIGTVADLVGVVALIGWIAMGIRERGARKRYEASTARAT